MAMQFKQKRARETIIRLYHHKMGKNVIDPSDIAHTFRDYYAALYNMKEDHTIT